MRPAPVEMIRLRAITDGMPDDQTTPPVASIEDKILNIKRNYDLSDLMTELVDILEAMNKRMHSMEYDLLPTDEG